MFATKLNLVTAAVLMLGALGLTFGLAVGQMEDRTPDPKPGGAGGDNKKVATSPPVPLGGGGGAKPAAPQDENWLPYAKNRLISVHIERCLYEVKGEERFRLAVRITNVTDTEIGVDLRGQKPGLTPNTWCVQDAKQRHEIDEKRALHAAPDPDTVRADFKAARLTAIPAGKSMIVYTVFDGSGRADVDRCAGKYLIVGIVGQLVATDGKTVTMVSCNWTGDVGPAQTDVVLPFPVTWKATDGAVKGTEPPVKNAGDDKPRTIEGVVKEVNEDSILLVSGERVVLTEKTEYLRETGFDAATAKLSDVSKGTLVYIGTTKQADKLVAHVVVIELIQPKAKGIEGNKDKPLGAPKLASGPDAVMKAMDGFRKALPEPQGLNEQNGLGVTDIDGVAHPDSHLHGIATRLGVKTRTECMVLLTYLKDPDPKIRRIAAFAIEGVVKAYPHGMSSSNLEEVDSEGHRKMVNAFIAGIEKLPK